MYIMEFTLRIALITILGILQSIMAFFTIRIIIAKVSGNNENFLYFKEKKDNIYNIAQVFTFATLLILFMPNQEKLEFSPKEIKVIFTASILGLVNSVTG